MLEIWEARSFEKALESGRTKPIVARCVANYHLQNERGLIADVQGGETGPAPKSFVLKSLGHPEVRETSLFFEVFGNLLARDFGIVTPAPALILLTPAFVQSVNPVVAHHGIKLRPGFGVGSEYLSAGLANFSLSTHWRPELLKQAVAIYAFDLLIQNGDRRPDKPNCAFDGHNIVAFDFELAFGFVYEVVRLGKPWEFSKQNIAPRHLFQAVLFKESPDWSEFAASVENLNERRLEELIKGIPEEWRASAEKVVNHLMDVSDNAKRLTLELSACLSQIEKQAGDLWN